jgi:chromosome partitioning protein
MRVISIANQKGGCGKTTTAISLSACLAHRGKRVLLIDMDPQGHVALGLNIDTNDRENTVLSILEHSNGSRLSLADISENVSENFDVVPADISLSTLEQHLSMVEGRETRLKHAISRVHSLYDIIVIDCPPSLGLLTFNALIAASEVFVPIEMSLFSLHGISKLMEIIESIKKKTGHEIHTKVLGTIVDKRTRISREVLENMKIHFGDSMFETVIRSNVTLKEAAGYGKSIIDYSKKASGFKDYMMLAEEVLIEKGTGHNLPGEDGESMFLKSNLEKRFSYFGPDAKSVKIGGNFNDWNPTDEFLMERDEYGTWTKNIVLKPGTYQYKFIVDGEWVEDHNNSKYINNAYGGNNSVLEIG